MSQHRNQRWKFSLKTLLVVLTVCCFATGWVAWGINDRRQHDMLVRQLEEKGYTFRHGLIESLNSFSPVAWMGVFDSQHAMHVMNVFYSNGSPYPADLLALGRFQNLSQLTIQGSRLSPECLRAIGQLRHLDLLDLSNSTLPSAVELQSLRRLSSLVALKLGGTNLSNDDLVAIRNCSAVEALDLSGCSITDDGTANLMAMTKLQRLDLRSTPISDQCISRLAGIRGLRYVDISRTDVSTEGATELRKLRPKLFVETRSVPPTSQRASVVLTATSDAVGQSPMNAS